MGAAADFLHGYGFALLIVIAAIGALAYAGVFSQERCVVNGGFGCSNLHVTHDEVSFTLQNQLGVAIDDLIVNSTCGTAATGQMDPDARAEFTLPCVIEKKIALDMQITYNKSNDTRRTYYTFGRITGRAQR